MNVKQSKALSRATNVLATMGWLREEIKEARERPKDMMDVIAYYTDDKELKQWAWDARELFPEPEPPCTALVCTDQGRVTVEAVGILELQRPTVNRIAARELLELGAPFTTIVESVPVIPLKEGSVNLVDDLVSAVDAFLPLDVPEEGIEDIAEVTLKELGTIHSQFPVLNGLRVVTWERDSKRFSIPVREENLERHLSLYLNAGWATA